MTTKINLIIIRKVLIKGSIMSNFGKKVLKYLISAILIYIVAVMVTTYFKENRIAFDINYLKEPIPFLVTFCQRDCCSFSTLCVLSMVRVAKKLKRR